MHSHLHTPENASPSSPFPSNPPFPLPLPNLPRHIELTLFPSGEVQTAKPS